MHIFDVSKRFMGGHAIVGGQLPIACGLGFASKYQEENSIVLCFLGDGAVNEGEFHESMNLASLVTFPSSTPRSAGGANKRTDTATTERIPDIPKNAIILASASSSFLSIR